MMLVTVAIDSRTTLVDYYKLLADVLYIPTLTTKIPLSSLSVSTMWQTTLL